MDKLKGISQTYVKCYNGEIIHSMQQLHPCPCRGRAVNACALHLPAGKGQALPQEMGQRRRPGNMASPAGRAETILCNPRSCVSCTLLWTHLALHRIVHHRKHDQNGLDGHLQRLGVLDMLWMFHTVLIIKNKYRILVCQKNLAVIFLEIALFPVRVGAYIRGCSNRL